MTTDVLHNVEGTKHWTPDPDITPKQLYEMREEVFERIRSENQEKSDTTS